MKQTNVARVHVGSGRSNQSVRAEENAKIAITEGADMVPRIGENAGPRHEPAVFGHSLHPAPRERPRTEGDGDPVALFVFQGPIRVVRRGAANECMAETGEAGPPLPKSVSHAPSKPRDLGLQPCRGGPHRRGAVAGPDVSAEKPSQITEAWGILELPARSRSARPAPQRNSIKITALRWWSWRAQQVCAMPNDAATREAYPALHGKRILVVEDNAVAAVDYHFQLQAVGAAESLQPTVRRALAYLADHEVDAAIVGYQPPDGDCEPVLEQLARRHIPFVIVSGDTFGMREMPSGTAQAGPHRRSLWDPSLTSSPPARKPYRPEQKQPRNLDYRHGLSGSMPRSLRPSRSKIREPRAIQPARGYCTICVRSPPEIREPARH
jgi:CheY-like chemotaxis protein